ncbi:MAG: class I SAM-dependent methyltransferase [Eubacterium sp.]|nr:class I SAM-dependent methyltransferase [Eubacterium sp.]
MSQYKFFAKVYDRMMDNIPYDEWKQFLLQLMYRYKVKPCAKIAELGCGTGTMTMRLAEDGFQMTGIDLSEEMLEAARAKDPYSDYKCMDMRELVLPEKQDVIISVCDSMNYLLTTEDLYKTIAAARDNLKEGGIFIFDLKTEYFYKVILDGYTDKDDFGDFSYVWKNIYDYDTKIHKYYLKFRYTETDEIGRKVDKAEREVHRQRAFSAAEIREAAERAGFTHAAVYGGSCIEKPRLNSERIFICLQVLPR